MLRLSASGLSCVRGFRRVFSDLSFQLRSGEALALTGPNGAGKSSLLRLTAGLLRPAAGTIALEGGEAERTIGEQAHYLGHLDALKPALTVAENLTFWCRYLNGVASPPEAGLAAVGLEALVAPAPLTTAAGLRELVRTLTA
jgi:heme exporter protein A